MEPDFSGFATKAGLKCSDGRTIMKDAFAHQDKATVPLVWHHGHSDPENVLGYVTLEARDGDVYAHGYFNDTPKGQSAKKLVQHGDITWLSIYANQLVEKTKQVFHGAIREVSLVLAGANPGARIDFVNLAHSDYEMDENDAEEAAYITTGIALEHSDVTVEDAPVEHADGTEKTVQEVYDSMTDEQKEVTHFMISKALETADEAVQHSDSDDESEEDESDENDNESEDDESDDNSTESDDDLSDDDSTEDSLNHQEGSDMSRNVFDRNDDTKVKPKGAVLNHSQIQTIFDDAEGKYKSLKDSFMAHAEEYGITDIDMLFPDAKAVTTTPEFLSRRMEWVADVLDGAKHSPFSRVKSIHADITADEARARGYVKGNLKKDEIIKLLKRVTTPTTVYKKQKLDRDDVVDITDFDVVVWLKGEMRLMLEEELARAILIGDGREPDDEDKIDEDRLRPIAWDDEMYAHPVVVPSNISAEGTVESIIRARKNYKGTGRPTLYTTDDILTDMLLIKDKMGRYTYDTEAALAAKLRVEKIVVVEVMESTPDLLGVIVNIADYTIGADRGGALAMFDDFDIDYNQQKYLLETRVSGALTKAKSAVVIKRTSGTTVNPVAPSFDEASNTITVPNVTGVEYYDVTDPTGPGTKLNAGDTVITKTTDVEARPVAGYNFPHNTDADWTYAYTA